MRLGARKITTRRDRSASIVHRQMISTLKWSLPIAIMAGAGAAPGMIHKHRAMEEYRNTPAVVAYDNFGSSIDSLITTTYTTNADPSVKQLEQALERRAEAEHLRRERTALIPEVERARILFEEKSRVGMILAALGGVFLASIPAYFWRREQEDIRLDEYQNRINAYWKG